MFYFGTELCAQSFGLQIKDNKIVYENDVKGNRILDFSYCGYKNSETDIPILPNSIFVPKQEGDASETIQRAIDYVSTLKPNTNGFRGVVLLDKGVFKLYKSLRISTSGVVLRGLDRNQTILMKYGYDRSALLHIEGVNNKILSEPYQVTSEYVAVNNVVLELNDVSNLKVGDRIAITRPSSNEWIKSVGCDIFGGGISALGWKPGDVDLTWDREIVSISGNKLTLNAPLSVALDSSFGKTVVRKYKWSGRISESGVENLTLKSNFNTQYTKDEDHCWVGVSIENAVNCWVKQLNFYHFAGSAVILQPSSMQITVEDCIAKEPISEIGGFRRITFYSMGQLNLIQRCYSENGINDFAAGYCAPGPNAFVQCGAKNALGFSGSIDAWACGLLFDIVDIDGHNLTFKNLGQNKNGAGWNTANSLFWQCTAAEIECYSPSSDAINRSFGCWGQFSGDGLWAESNNHVHPRSFFYAQLAARVKNDVSSRARLMPKKTDASSSPSIEEAQRMTKEATEPLLTIEKWIEQANLQPISNQTKLLSVQQIKKTNTDSQVAVSAAVGIVNGKLLVDGALMVGAKLDVQWWSGKLKPNYIASNMTKPHVTRFVSGREGFGLTDRIDSVVSFMKNKNMLVLDHNYGLWTDRRRDDHERIRRRDGDVWGPGYEQPFARSGIGLAYDGLSKYDLNRPNEWYWMRLKEYADKGQKAGLLLFHQHFFQHNIIEAGAHWVDCPWRTANNINDLGFPEPVNFAGDKRIFYSELFYDITNPIRRQYYRQYIRKCLENFADNKNVIQLISAEYTGPLHFVQFWLDVINEWQTETGKDALVALSTTKDVQDSILQNPAYARLIDIIDIRYWHYKNDGTTYAPLGGLNLAPRQHARLTKVGKVTFNEAYKAVAEYRSKYPDKAVTYFGEKYSEMAWAVFMAGGSCPSLNIKDAEFLRAAAQMKAVPTTTETYHMMVKTGVGCVIYPHSKGKITLDIAPGAYELRFVDATSGEIKLLQKMKKHQGKLSIDVDKENVGVYWILNR